MNFNKVMKMKNRIIKQPDLNGDLGRLSYRTKKERNLSNLEENEKKSVLMSSLISRLMVTKNQDNRNLRIRPVCSNKAVKESTKEDIHNDEGKVQVVQDVSAAEKPADNVQFEDEREDCPVPNAKK